MISQNMEQTLWHAPTKGGARLAPALGRLGAPVRLANGPPGWLVSDPIRMQHLWICRHLIMTVPNCRHSCQITCDYRTEQSFSPVERNKYAGAAPAPACCMPHWSQNMPAGHNVTKAHSQFGPAWFCWHACITSVKFKNTPFRISRAARAMKSGVARRWWDHLVD